jgi:hypothetical protein
MFRTCLWTIALVCTACSGLGINDEMGFKLKGATSVSPSLFPGGATAVYVVSQPSGFPAPNVQVVSSNPAVVKVTGVTDANSEVTLTTGIEGEAQISVARPSARPSQFTVKVEAPTALVLRGTYLGSAVPIVAGETVSLVVIGRGTKDVHGSGTIAFSVEGPLTLRQGTPIDGEARVYFSGTPGTGKVLATDGTRTFEQAIIVVRNDTLDFTPSVTTSGTKPLIRFELLSSEGEFPHQPVYGGSCDWAGLVTGAFDDHTRADVIGDFAGRSVSVTLPQTGEVTVTCRIGQLSKPIVLR